MEQEPPGQVLQTEQSESPEVPREFVLSDSHEMVQPARRDSVGSVKSLRSYRSVRESLGKMHAYVDMVTKLDSKKHSQVLEETPDHLNASIDKLNRSQAQLIECISELDSEHEFSSMPPQPEEVDMPVKETSLFVKRRCPSSKAERSVSPLKRLKVAVEGGFTSTGLSLKKAEVQIKRGDTASKLLLR